MGTTQHFQSNKREILQHLLIYTVFRPKGRNKKCKSRDIQEIISLTQNLNQALLKILLNNISLLGLLWNAFQ